MPRISQRTIDQVKERAKILDAFEGQELKRMGREFVTRCPWHDDRKPSLSISPQKNFAYCHVCQHGVDSLGWLQDRGLTFTEAVESLARRYNVTVEMEDAADNEKLIEERKQRAILYTKREKQEAAFSADLFANRDACLYLKDRGITKATAQAWGMGLHSDRLMIPLRDSQGRTVAFTGRALADQMPKYKNSPNDLLFDKSKLVFGLDRAIPAIRKSREVVIVEGQFDVIKLHQEGIENVVACSGTALTMDQVEALVRRCGAETVTLCFDGDAAGEKAAMKALEKLQQLALSETISLKILSLNAGDDPDSLCRERGATYVKAVFAQAPNWVEWWLKRELKKVDLNDVEQVARAEAGVKRILSVLPVGPRRAYVERTAAEVLGAAPKVKPAAPVVTKKQRDAIAWAERRAVRCYLLVSESRAELSNMALTVPPYAEAWQLIRYLEGCVDASLVSAMFGRVIRSMSEQSFHELRSLLQPVPEVLQQIKADPRQEVADTLTGLASRKATEATAAA